jgi:hypothetical protein
MPESNSGGGCEGTESSFAGNRSNIQVFHGSPSVTTGITIYPGSANTITKRSRDSVIITGNTLNGNIRLLYRYYKWWCLSSSVEYFNTVNIPFTIALNSTNYHTVSFKDQGIERDPDWSISYRSSVSPFQPVIFNNNGKKCAHAAFDIELDENTPLEFVGDNKNNTFEWQYGQIETVIRDHPYFQYSKYFMMNYLETKEYSDRYNVPEMYKIREFIMNANYIFFALYPPRTMNEESFVNTMQGWWYEYSMTGDGNNDPNYINLSYKDYNFISTHIGDAARSAYQQNPYFPYNITQ